MKTLSIEAIPLHTPLPCLCLSADVRVDEKLVCKEYDTGFTARVYNDKGLVGDFGVGMQFRLFQRLDEGKGTCEGDIDVQFVSRFEKCEQNLS